MYTFVSFTVAELFEKVWQIPMVKLAKTLVFPTSPSPKLVAKPASLSLGVATGPNRKSSDNANPNLLRSKAMSDSKCSTVTTRSPRLALT